MNTRFVRVNSTDGIELDGLIYTPNEPTNKVIYGKDIKES